ncbi:OCIA domain-containing protein 1 [Schistocerca piceifrons]|uniref:OCIA domain-containing protein 1 n=1 Tax=Schistocerca piceifrons TaxID=274613 RepID=UPI001F5F6B64|nr:OCIA domain-containing protein 1 [Schistocerca piceifrons]
MAAPVGIDGLDPPQNPDTHGAPHGRLDPQFSPQMPYRLTMEEVRVLRQCNRDSFYQRSLPFATILGGTTYLAVKSGYFKAHPRFGATPKVIVAGLLGYFVGKVSYQSRCAEKLMQLPNSRIGEALRQRKRQGNQEILTMDPSFGAGVSLPTFGSLDTFSDVGPQHDLDSGYPASEGLDDTYRPTLDSPAFEEEMPLPEAQQRSTTYEELRRKNREEYEQKKTKPYRGIAGTDEVPTVIRQQTPLEEQAPKRPTPPPSWNKPKNKYGDVWEE